MESSSTATKDNFIDRLLAPYPGAKVLGVRTYFERQPTPEERAEAERLRLLDIEKSERELRYGIARNATPYLAYARQLWLNGWTTFPQDRSSERLPAKIPGGRVKWSHYQERRHTRDEVEGYRSQCAVANVAYVTGKTSGHTFVFDLDVNDADTSAAVFRIMEEVCGTATFVRQANAPRSAAIYRYDPETPVKREVIKLKDGGAVEILGVSTDGLGLAFTLLGHHYRTNREFAWPRLSPVTYGPEHAPVVTTEMMDAFRARIADEIGVVVPKANDYREVEPSTWDGEVLVPGGAKHVQNVTLDPVSKRVTDGRNSWLFSRSRRFAGANSGIGLAALVDAVEADFKKHCVVSGHWLHDLRTCVRDQCKRAQWEIKTGKVKVGRTLTAENRLLTTTAVSSVSSTDADIVGLLPTARATLKMIARTEIDAAEAERRALKDYAERRADTDRVAAEVIAYMQLILDAIWDGDEAAMAMVQLLIAPTGSGKTSTFLRLLANQIARRGPLGRPILLLTPSYKNIAENEERLAGYVKEAKSPGLKVVVYIGKTTGCILLDQIAQLQKHHVGTQAMCETTLLDEKGEKILDENGDAKKDTCREYGRCPVVAAKRDAPFADLVMLPTAFFSLGVAAELKKQAALVVVDEQCWPGLVSTNEFELASLKMPRPVPFAGSEEQAVGLTGEDMLQARDIVADVADKALREGRDVADVVNAFVVNGIPGLTMVRHAIKVCDSAADFHRHVRPNMTPEKVQWIVTRPRSQDAWNEARLWRIVEDRVNALNALTSARQAKGEFDVRIQLLDKDSEKPLIRMSWRSKSPLANHPTLLLDASASPDIIEKIWGGRQVETRIIDAPLFQRVVWAPNSTFSNTMLIPSVHEYGLKAMNSAKNLVAIRALTDKLAGYFGYGRVLVGSTKSVRTAMNSDWAHAGNVDTAHFGAVAGINDFESHSALLSVGRLELPVRAIDGIVAALTYDDEVPELPIDRNGNGLDNDGTPLKVNMVPRTVRMRDGSDVTMPVPEYAGHWARIVQRQYREEQQRQMIGRLRPVYREGEPPLVVILSSVIPEDVIVDEIVHSADIGAQTEIWTSIKRCGALTVKLDGPICGDLGAFGPIVRAVRELNEMGLSGTRIGKGLTRVRVHVASDGRVGAYAEELYIPSYDDAGTMVDAHYKWHGRTVTKLEVLEVGAERALAQPRRTDAAFEAKVGTLEQRVWSEEQVKHAVGMELIEEPALMKRKNHLVPAGPLAPLDREWVLLDVRAALRTVRQP